MASLPACNPSRDGAQGIKGVTILPFGGGVGQGNKPGVPGA